MLMLIKCKNSKRILNVTRNYFNFFKGAITFLPEFFFGSGKNCEVLNITFEITHRCNLSCGICPYMNHNWTKESKEELDLKAIKNIVAQGAQIGTSFFVSGGEPFIRRDIMDILSVIKGNGLKCGVVTNGTLLNKDIIISLADMGLDQIIFSIHGSEEDHDRIVGSTGAYKKAAKNLRLFSKYKKNTKLFINRVISPATIASLTDAIYLAKDNNVDKLFYQHLSFLGHNEMKNFIQVKEKLMQDKEEIELLLNLKPLDCPPELLYEKIQEVITVSKRNRVKAAFKPALDLNGIKSWYGNKFVSTKKCVYPWVAMRIGPNGDVYLCPNVLMKIGNVRRSQIKELINNDRARLFRKTLSQEKGMFSICARCCKLYISPFGKI